MAFPFLRIDDAGRRYEDRREACRPTTAARIDGDTLVGGFIMSDKPIWQGIAGFLGRKGSRSSGKLTTVEQRCPVCQNALDPRWTKCPYCEAAKNAGTQTSRVAPEPATRAAPAAAASQAATSSRPATRVDMGEATNAVDAGASQQAMAPEPGAGGGGRRHTIVEPVAEGSLGVERHVGGGRRITGIVTTFTWSRVGQLYIVRDGRNFAGSGVVSSDNNAPCEILVSEDRTMSSAHFLILCQGGKYIVNDNFSTNGTFVNGEQIDTRGTELVDNAVIKAGATVFRFQKILSAGGPAPEAPRESAGWRPGDNEDPVA